VRQPQELSDAALAISASQGSHSAFAALMRRHKGWLYQFIRRYVTDRDDAYDVLQESFVAAWGAIGRFDPERPLEAWLRRIALNKCRDRARRNAVRRAAMTVFGFSITSEPAMPAVNGASESNNALRRLETAIAGLPRQLKEPLVLTALEGLSHREAGDLLGINAKAVETRVYRAKRRLADVLEPADLTDLVGEN
jgi:RNA polymerase sigma factor (sigma-70 family)